MIKLVQDAKNQIDLHKLRFTILPNKDLVIQRKNLSTIISVLRLNQGGVLGLAEIESAVKEQIKHTSEVLQAVTSRIISKEEALDLIKERNGLINFYEPSPLAFQSQIYWASSGPKNSTTIRATKRTSTNKIYFASQGKSREGGRVEEERGGMDK